MPVVLTAAAVAAVIQAHPVIVDQALGFLGGGAADFRLDAVENLALLRNRDLGEMLLSLLEETRQTEAFVAMLRARQVPISATDAAPFQPAPPPDAGQDLGQVTEPGFDLEGLGRFAFRAKAFRCRIMIDGAVMGSGAFVSPRLVLTAAHVVEALQNGQRLEVWAEDGRRYPARVVWQLPCHPDEHKGILPPADAADTHTDAALLKLMSPVGRRLAEMALPEAVDDGWTGTRNLFLVHFPQGDDKGGAVGRVRRAAGDLRLVHDIATDPGSSGGPGFDRQLGFVGLHQGRLNKGNNRRLVPFDRFARNDGFRAEVAADRQVSALWSLDGSTDGHIILGRGLFFDAVRAIALQDLPMLAGIWVRRSDPAVVTGLSFSQKILIAFLHALGTPAEVHVVPTEQGVRDVIASIDAMLTESGGGVVAFPGVRSDETSEAASDADRATQVLDRLAARAKDSGRRQWLFLENPPEGLLQRAQFQLEHLVRLSLRVPDVTLVLAGFETYGLVDTRFETLDDAQTARKPGILVETLGDVAVDDIRATLAEASGSIGLDWSADVITHEAEAVLTGVPQTGGRVPPDQLGLVAVRIAEVLRKRLVA